MKSDIDELEKEEDLLPYLAHLLARRNGTARRPNNQCRFQTLLAEGQYAVSYGCTNVTNRWPARRLLGA